MKKTTIYEDIWNLLVSMKFATILLTVLGGISMVSMLINEYPNFFSESSILHQLLQQHSPYSSWWYRGLLSLLFLSLLFCVIQRFVPMMNQLKYRPFRNEDWIKSLDKYYTIRGDSSELKTKSLTLLKKLNFKTLENPKEGVTEIVASKYRLSGVGSWISHVGMLVIFIGAVLYSSTETKSFRYLIGQEHRRGNVIGEDLAENWFEWNIPISKTETVKVVVDSFRVHFYDDRQMISDYRSYIGLYSLSGEKLRTHELTVNNPLLYKNAALHQSDYKPLVSEFFSPRSSFRDSKLERALRMQERGKVTDNWITGLSYKQYNGKPVIMLGMLLSFTGLFTAFLFWRRDLWISIQNNKLIIGGRTVKNAVAFERELQNISERIKHE